MKLPSNESVTEKEQLKNSRTEIFQKRILSAPTRRIVSFDGILLEINVEEVEEPIEQYMCLDYYP